MPRKHFLPERELPICERLREYRKKLKLSRVDFAQEAGIDSSILAAIEYARTPLRYGVAFKIFSRMNLSPRWLATGEGEMADLWIAAPGPGDLEVSDRSLFSEIWHERIQTLAAAQAKRVHPLSPVRQVKWTPETSIEGRLAAEKSLIATIGSYCTSITDADFPKFVNGLWHRIEELGGACDRDHDATILDRIRRMEPARAVSQQRVQMLRERPRRVDSKALLDNAKRAARSKKVAFQSDPLRALVIRLRRATESHGARSQLARDLHVTRQAVNNWLSETSAPTAETTLRLLEWVQAMEK